MQPLYSPARRWSRLVVALVLVAFIAGPVGAPLPAMAKEFAITGIIDCGVKSGRSCPDGSNVIGVRTDQITGKLQTHKVDIAWVLKQAPGLHQDDEICIEVRDDARTDGVLQAIGFLDKCDRTNPRTKRAEDDDDGNTAAPQEPTGDALPCYDVEGDLLSQLDSIGIVFPDAPGTQATFQIQMRGNEGEAVLFAFVFGGELRFQIFYEGTEVLDSGFGNGLFLEDFTFGPGSSTRLEVVVTRDDDPSLGLFVVTCELPDIG